MTKGTFRLYRVRECIGRAGLWLFLGGILASVASSLAGWSDGWHLATIALTYPGLPLLLGPVAIGDLAMLCTMAARAPGKRGHWLGWLFLASRGGAMLVLFLLFLNWEAKLLAARLGA